jgi:hypothetical protein
MTDTQTVSPTCDICHDIRRAHALAEESLSTAKWDVDASVRAAAAADAHERYTEWLSRPVRYRADDLTEAYDRAPDGGHATDDAVVEVARMASRAADEALEDREDVQRWRAAVVAAELAHELVKLDDMRYRDALDWCDERTRQIRALPCQCWTR